MTVGKIAELLRVAASSNKSLNRSGGWARNLKSKSLAAARLAQALCREKYSVVKFTKYFQTIRSRPDRAIIKDEWIQRVIDSPEREYIQADGRLRRWSKIDENEGRYLRVVLLPDGETIHNAFFDRGYKP